MLHTPRAYRGMVTAPHHLASQAGLDILKNGGTAAEACVAITATLAVAYPRMTGVGGDGFWPIAEPDGTVRAIDACGKAAPGPTTRFTQGSHKHKRRCSFATPAMAHRCRKRCAHHAGFSAGPGARRARR